MTHQCCLSGVFLVRSSIQATPYYVEEHQMGRWRDGEMERWQFDIGLLGVLGCSVFTSRWYESDIARRLLLAGDVPGGAAIVSSTRP